MTRSTLKKSKNGINLYWVTTADHDEDWFILAASAHIAKKFHENHGDYNRGDADAELILSDVHSILNLPEPHDTNHCNTYPRHAEIEDLRKFGFEIINDGEVSFRRIVRLGERTFEEGVLELLVEAAIRKRSGIDKDNSTIN